MNINICDIALFSTLDTLFVLWAKTIGFHPK